VRKIWFDQAIGRLNTESKGHFLGSFQPEDKIVVFYRNGQYEIKDTEPTQRFDSDQIVLIEKFNPEKIVSVVYHDQEKNQYTAKRFRIETQTENSKFSCIREGEGNSLAMVTTFEDPILLILTGKGTNAKTSKIKLAEFVELTGWKAIGIKLTEFNKSTVFDWAHRTGVDDQQVELF
jgi:topoisomerase-4 subunit A